MSNPQVNRDSPLGSPQDVYLGIFSSAEQVRQVLKAARELGVPPDGLEVFARPGDETAFANVTTRRVEDAEGAATFFRMLFNADEVRAEKVYHDAIRKGEYVLQVGVPEDDKERRAAVEAAMLGQGGRFINYFGRLVHESVVSGKSPNDPG